MMTIQEAVEKFGVALTGEAAPRTIEWYLGKLHPLATYLGERDVADVSLEDLRRWRATLSRREMTPWTLHGYVRAARRLFGWLTAEGKLAENPAAKLNLPPLPEEPPKDISERDFRLLVQQATHEARQGDRWAKRDLALLLFLADTGCRVGGLVGLRRTDLHLAEGRATVREKGKGGQRKARIVFFGPATTNALTAWLAVAPRSKLVFAGQRGKASRPLARSTVLRILAGLGKRAGVEGRCNPHSLRHRYALRMLDNGAPLPLVSRLMGHADIETTATFYGKWRQRDVEEAARRFSTLTDLDI